MAIKKNGTLFCWLQYLKKLEVLALTNWSVAVEFELWPAGQSTENQTKLYNFQTTVIFLPRKYLYYLLEWYTGWNPTLPTTLSKFRFSFILSFILSLTSTSPQNFQWLSSGCVKIFSGTPGPWPLCQPKFEKSTRKYIYAVSTFPTCGHLSPCFDDTLPIQTDEGTSQIHCRHWGLRPLLFSNNVTGSFMSPSNLRKGWNRKGQRLNVTAQWCDHLNWKMGFTASMISPVFLKTLVDGFSPLISYMNMYLSQSWFSSAF